MKIVLAEDDDILNELITDFLKNDGYFVKSFKDGNKTYEYLKNEKLDILILDINLPGIDGLTILKELQKQKISPHTIIISAINDIEHINKAYELGCYDYIKKPFYLQELLIKIKRLEKNIHPDNKVFVTLSNKYIFDIDNNILLFNYSPVVLSKIHTKIIRLLALNKGKTITFETLQNEIWNGMVDNATIRAEMSRLKKFLKEDFIKNIRGVGYIIK